jgi:hypothetical protein
MNIISFSRFYISYLIFNIGGWIYFGYLLLYTNYITTENCNPYTKELTDGIKILVGISMSMTTLNVRNATSIFNKERMIEDLYCLLIFTGLCLTISSINALVIFGLTTGMTDIKCSNDNAEFGLKLAVYGVLWIVFIELLMIIYPIMLFLRSIIVNAQLHLLCKSCFNICKKYNERRIGIDSHPIPSLPMYNTNQISIPMYNTNPISIPKPVLKEENKILCSICYDSSITLLLEPCNHICICQLCYHSLIKNECPICKTPISSTKKIYFANSNF